MKCLRCGAPVLMNDYCSECGLKQEYIYKTINTSNYYYNIGLDRAKVRDLSGAVEALKLALKYNKNHTDARNLLGLIYFETGEVVEALSHWVVSVNYQTEDNLANEYIKIIQGNQSKLQSLNHLVKKYNQTLAYARQGSKDLALIQLKKVLSMNPHFVNGYLLLALLYMDAGNYDKARKALYRVVRVDKNNTLAQKYFLEMGSTPKEVMAIREQAVELDKEASREEREGDVQSEAASKAKAASIISKSMERSELEASSLQVGNYKETSNGRFQFVYLLVGLLVGGLFMGILGVPNYKKSLQHENEQLKVKYSEELSQKNVTISTLQEEKNSLQEQLSVYTSQSDEIAANGTNAVNYEKIIKAENYFVAGNMVEAVKSLCGINPEELTMEEAKAIYQKIMDQEKENAINTLYQSGIGAMEAGSYDDAIGSFESILAIDGDRIDAIYQLLLAYEGKGDTEKAEPLKNRILTDFPDSQQATELNKRDTVN